MIVQLLMLASWTAGIALTTTLVSVLLYVSFMIRFGYVTGILEHDDDKAVEEYEAWIDTTLGGALRSIMWVSASFFLIGIVAAGGLLVARTVT
jgi:hypothetical protein